MKNLLLLLVLSLSSFAIFSNQAVAGNSCLVEMRTPNGQVIRGFKSERCADASYSCEQERDSRVRAGKNGNTECVIAPRAEKMPVRGFVRTLEFKHDKTAEAYNQCLRQRSANSQCSQPQSYECTPCTIESHTNHSEYELYKINYR